MKTNPGFLLLLFAVSYHCRIVRAEETVSTPAVLTGKAMAVSASHAEGLPIKISLGLRDRTYLLAFTNVPCPLAFRIENTGKTAIKADLIPELFSRGVIHALRNGEAEQRADLEKDWDTMVYDLKPGATFESPLVSDILSFFPAAKDGDYQVWWTLGDLKSNPLLCRISNGKVLQVEESDFQLPVLTGKVTFAEGSFFGYSPPRAGDSMKLDLGALSSVTNGIAFKPSKPSGRPPGYIPLPSPLRIERIECDQDGKLRLARLISGSQNNDGKDCVIVDILCNGTEGTMWIIQESEIVDSVARLDCRVSK